MTILCIETSTSVCSAAICKDGEPYKQCICREGSNHARLLPRYIEELLRFAAEQDLSIEAVALSEGPGSYTGLRIGTSTAKGLCYGLDVPLMPVPTLEILNEAARQKGIEGRLIPLIDARRMEVYTTDENGKARAVVVENEASLYEGDDEVYYFGDGAEKCSRIFTKPNWHFVPGIVPEAQYAGALAESGKRKEENVNLAYYEPFYLKEFIAAQSHVKGLK
ncbi:MAG: tRNA (adenosine(37)-N6)-threonylcarbamoyltransferase complex dimerization subunit type 1 TsaB [Paludibacteraceae bacterium]|nr:tRNA (adenosine(37)-N6)-threonylcarbamoyltransferase complex dimerization subunit type 1 TsaB [Paludibacteraceae bacterium]